MPEIVRDRNAILVRSSILVPNWPAPGRYKLAVDGTVVDHATYGISTPQLGAKFKNSPAGVAGFAAKLFVQEVFGTGTEATLRIIDEETGEFARAWDHFFLSRTSPESSIPIPSAELSYRVMAVRNLAKFVEWGHSIKRKYEHAIRPYVASTSSRPVLLDWGCGCGRLARHLYDQCDYYGIDIDAEAVAWCQTNIPLGTFSQLSLRPETNFSSDLFDIIIGNSVFTHLSEQDQFLWLKELRRISKPSATVAVSVNCATSLFNAADPPRIVSVLQEHGYCNAGPDLSLKGVTSNDDYYRAAFHTQDYIWKQWSQYFSILDILPGFVGNIQDLVIMRPRK